jgi:hypothetical protein
MQLLIVRRWGSNLPGDKVNVTDATQARWLLDNSFATHPNQPESATSGAAAPGTHGPDIKAGGDHTRRRPATRKGVYPENRAWPVAGSPVPYTAGISPDALRGRSEDPEPVASGPSTKVSGSGRRRKAD